MRERLAQLLERYDTEDWEERTPLLREMRAAGGVTAAGELALSPEAADRWLAARLMELLPDEAHVEPLGSLVRDEHPEVAESARHALRGQVRSPEWQALVEELARSDDPALARQAGTWLTEGVRG